MKKRLTQFASLMMISVIMTSCGEKEASTEKKDSNSKSETNSDSLDQTPKIEYAYRDMTVEEFAVFHEDPSAFLLDVRTKDEFEFAKIDGAINIDVLEDDFTDRALAEVDKSKSVYVYCHGGGRSADAAQILIDNGYQNVYNLEGGFQSWQAVHADTLE